MDPFGSGAINGPADCSRSPVVVAVVGAAAVVASVVAVAS